MWFRIHTMRAIERLILLESLNTLLSIFIFNLIDSSVFNQAIGSSMCMCVCISIDLETFKFPIFHSISKCYAMLNSKQTIATATTTIYERNIVTTASRSVASIKWIRDLLYSVGLYT